MTEFQETSSVPELPLKGRVKKQFNVFKDYLKTMFGFSEKESKRFQEFSEPTEVEELGKRQLKLKEKIVKNLRRKGILVSDRENWNFYKKDFGCSGFTAPEAFLKFPGGATFWDDEAQQVKIYLNPYLSLFKPDYQLLAVLEEAIHWYQLKHNNRRRVILEDEIDVRTRFLKIADFLGLDEQRVEFIKQIKTNQMAELEDLHKNVQKKHASQGAGVKEIAGR